MESSCMSFYFKCLIIGVLIQSTILSPYGMDPASGGSSIGSSYGSYGNSNGFGNMGMGNTMNHMASNGKPTAIIQAILDSWDILSSEDKCDYVSSIYQLPMDTSKPTGEYDSTMNMVFESVEAHYLPSQQKCIFTTSQWLTFWQNIKVCSGYDSDLYFPTTLSEVKEVENAMYEYYNITESNYFFLGVVQDMTNGSQQTSAYFGTPLGVNDFFVSLDGQQVYQKGDDIWAKKVKKFRAASPFGCVTIGPKSTRENETGLNACRMEAKMPGVCVVRNSKPVNHVLMQPLAYQGSGPTGYV